MKDWFRMRCLWDVMKGSIPIYQRTLSDSEQIFIKHPGPEDPIRTKYQTWFPGAYNVERNINNPATTMVQ